MKAYRKICKWCFKEFETMEWHEDCCSKECSHTKVDFDRRYYEDVDLVDWQTNI
jgi:hypothetical protein